MKYTRLTKEQLEAMHEDFARFLAMQQITSEEWKKIKLEQPHIAEEEIDIFSDLVWEKVLTEVRYLDKRELQSVFFFRCEEKQMSLLGIRVTHSQVDLTTTEGLNWLKNHLFDDSVELYKGKKEYQKERNLELFQLIEQGASIDSEQTYEMISKLL